MSLNTILPEGISCSCQEQTSLGRSPREVFLSCPVPYTFRPFPLSCIHNAHPPAPRLVGIEPNPGPNPPRRTTTSVTVKMPAKPLHKKPRPGKVGQNHGLAEDLVNTMKDPFEFGPIRLGWGTMVPTELATAYKRGAFNVASDGSFAISLNNQLKGTPQNMGLIWNAGSGLGADNSYTASNESAINGVSDLGRIVSSGLRLFALYPATEKPGVLFGGSLASQTPNSVAAYTVDNLVGLPSAELGFGGDGACVTSRPLDLVAFTFQSGVLTGSNGSISNYTIPFIAGQAFPADTQIWYEAIINLETIPRDAAGSLGQNLDAPAQPSLLDSFPSPEKAYAYIRKIVGSSVHMDGALDAAEVGLHLYGKSGAAKTLNTVRKLFGQGKHSKTVQVGESSAAQSRQNTIVIDEFEKIGSSSSASARKR